MFVRHRIGLVLGILALVLFPFGESSASPTGYFVAPEFQEFYARSGGLPVFGYAISDPMHEEDRLVQYFERQRFELHPQHAGTPYVVQLGLLGVQEATERGLIDSEPFHPRPEANAGPGVDYFPQTGHFMGNGFRDYWHSHGLEFGDPGISFRESLALFGYPISEEFVDPETGLVTQYFERARFEFHPENSGTIHAVLLGHVGKAEFQRVRGTQIVPRSEGGGANNPAPPPAESSGSDSGSSGNNTTPPSNPTTSIQTMVDNAASGATVHVPSGIYRETVSVTKPITLVAQPGAEIRGSDVWTGWTESGGRWVSHNSVPAFNNNHGECQNGSECRLQEQVFVNGSLLQRVSGNPGPGQFAVNGQRQVVLGENPNGRTVEVSVREHWILGRSNGVTIDGFTMKHAANRAQTGALYNGDHSNWTVRNNTLSYAHGVNVSLLSGSNLNLINNEISHAGQLGVAVWRGQDVRVEGNRLHHNNLAGYRAHWEAGGLKMAEAERVRVDGNEVFNNNGPGLWSDVDSRDVTFQNNRVYQNSHSGILYEISVGGRIVDNRVWENGHGVSEGPTRAGIFIQNSSDTEVANNIVAWNGGGIVVWQEERHVNRWNTVRNNLVRNNSIFIKATRNWDEHGLAWIEFGGISGMVGNGSNNRGEGNRYFHANPQQASWNTFTWGGASFGWNALQEFNATPGESNGRTIDNGEKNQILTNAGIPTDPQR